LTFQHIVADEHVDRIGDACARGRRDQAIEENEVRGEPAVPATSRSPGGRG
jgi:hypothetical protein